MPIDPTDKLMRDVSTIADRLTLAIDGDDQDLIAAIAAEAERVNPGKNVLIYMLAGRLSYVLQKAEGDAWRDSLDRRMWGFRVQNDIDDLD